MFSGSTEIKQRPKLANFLYCVSCESFCLLFSKTITILCYMIQIYIWKNWTFLFEPSWSISSGKYFWSKCFFQIFFASFLQSINPILDWFYAPYFWVRGVTASPYLTSDWKNVESKIFVITTIIYPFKIYKNIFAKISILKMMSSNIDFTIGRSREIQHLVNFW